MSGTGKIIALVLLWNIFGLLAPLLLDLQRLPVWLADYGNVLGFHGLNSVSSEPRPNNSRKRAKIDSFKSDNNLQILKKHKVGLDVFVGIGKNPVERL